MLARDGDPEAQALLDVGTHCPPLALRVWGFFLEMHRTRGQTGYGPLPITPRDVWYWQLDAGRRLAPWERGAVAALDMVYLDSVATSREAEAKRAKPKG